MNVTPRTIRGVEAEMVRLKRENAAMRDLLQDVRIGAMHEACIKASDYDAELDPNPTWHCCDWSEAVQQIDAALAATERQE